jgi:hypothetical protein
VVAALLVLTGIGGWLGGVFNGDDEAPTATAATPTVDGLPIEHDSGAFGFVVPADGWEITADEENKDFGVPIIYTAPNVEIYRGNGSPGLGMNDLTDSDTTAAAYVAMHVDALTQEQRDYCPVSEPKKFSHAGFTGQYISQGPCKFTGKDGLEYEYEYRRVAGDREDGTRFGAAVRLNVGDPEKTEQVFLDALTSFKRG